MYLVEMLLLITIHLMKTIYVTEDSSEADVF
jgi:hypothetical protein